MAISADPDETAHYEPSHLDLHCLNRYLYWSVGIKGLQMSAMRINHVETNLLRKERILVCLEYNGPVNTITEAMSSRSVYLTTCFPEQV